MFILPGMKGSMSFRSFIPITHTYTAGSGTEIVPRGAKQVVISVAGAGGGATSSAGLGYGHPGGLATRTVLLTSADWGRSLSFFCGTGGAGGTTIASPGNASGSSGTLTAISYNMTGGGGSAGGGSGGTDGSASGGTSNIVGGGSAGGVPSGEPGVPGSAGQPGRVQFAYT